MVRLRNKRLRYVVEYYDGKTETIVITLGMVLTGEHLVDIAERRQAAREIPSGSIAFVVPERAVRLHVE